MIKNLRILIVSEHASARFGGEAALPLHYFRILRRRGFQVWLVTHARTRGELAELFSDEERIVYVEDTLLHRAMWRVGRRLPTRIAYFTTGFISRLAVQLKQRRIVRDLVSRHGIDVIHQPMPVSPREPSLMYGFGVPVIIGPMNGGMDYPPSFRRRRGWMEQWTLFVARGFSSFLNFLLPGKRRASLLLVANSRTRVALPVGVSKYVVELVENGVDLATWRKDLVASEVSTRGSLTTFIFMGRLVDWKAVDLLLYAFKRAVDVDVVPMCLRIVGDGVERLGLEALAMELGILASTTDDVNRVCFTGWLPQDACAEEVRRADGLVLPSLLECGGAVVLEAMAAAKPVIATAWGGPADYLDESCGILVPPTSRDSLIQGHSEAMLRLATSRELRIRLGEAGREKVVRQYDWETKVDRILKLYQRAQDNRIRRYPSRLI